MHQTLGVKLYGPGVNGALVVAIAVVGGLYDVMCFRTVQVMVKFKVQQAIRRLTWRAMLDPHFMQKSFWIRRKKTLGQWTGVTGSMQ